MSWNQLSHAEEWVLFEKNIGPYVGIDEVSLSQGELYTILINKEKIWGIERSGFFNGREKWAKGFENQRV